jgi:acetyltransferase-like isoleucine patch superfamily enzyme
MLNLVSKIKSVIRVVRKNFYTNNVKRQCEIHGPRLRVNKRSAVTKQTILGTNVNFNGLRINGRGKVVIGDNFHSGEECLMISQNHNYDLGKAIPYDNTYILKDIIIKDNVWLGSRVIILGGVTIEEGAIIQAGSVVVSDIPYCGIAGGNPAKVFKYRDIEHYESLKRDEKFH